jgi:hypothetical protein
MIYTTQTTPYLTEFQGLAYIDAEDLRRAEAKVKTPYAIAVAAVNDKWEQAEHNEHEAVRLMLKHGWKIPAWNTSSCGDHQVLYLIKKFRHSPRKCDYKPHSLGCSDGTWGNFATWKRSQDGDYGFDDGDHHTDSWAPLQLYAGPPLSARQRVEFRKAKWRQIRGTPFFVKGRKLTKSALKEFKLDQVQPEE